MKAKKRQTQSQIRKLEKDLQPQTTDITALGKGKEYTSAERKFGNIQTRIQNADEQISSIKQPSEKQNIFGNLHSLMTRNDMYGQTKREVSNISGNQQDIPDDHSPDTQQEMPKITALGFQPNINKPGASHLMPDLQNATSSKFSPNIDKPNVSHFKPDMPDVTASRISPNVEKPGSSLFRPDLQKPNVVRSLDGLEDILQPPQKVTALGDTPQPKAESVSIAEDLKNIVESNTTQQSQSKLQPVGKPFIDTEDELGRVKQVTNPEAVKIRDSNLQLLDDAENDEERIRLLNTLTHQQLKDMTDTGAFGVNYHQEQTKKDYIASIIAKRNENNRREQTTANTTETATATTDTDYSFNLEDSYQGMPKSELKAAADKNNSLISSIKDEDTLRKRLSGLHVPMLRAMSGISESGYKKNDFINEIVRVATRPIPDGAKLKAGEFSVPGVNGTWTIKPNKAGNSFTIDNDDIPHSSMVYDPKENYFMSLSSLDRDTTGAVQDYFREHIKDFYEDGGNQTQTVQITSPAPVAENPATVKSDKHGKVRLQPLGNDNPDEIAEQNLDILRRSPNDYERKKLLNAQSMKTADLIRMREYIMRKYNTGMGVQGKRNDIINSIVKFINRDTHYTYPPQPEYEGEYPADLPARITGSSGSYEAISSILQHFPFQQLKNFALALGGYDTNSDKQYLVANLASGLSTRISNLKKGYGLDDDNDPIVRAFKESHPKKSEDVAQEKSHQQDSKPVTTQAETTAPQTKEVKPEKSQNDNEPKIQYGFLPHTWVVSLKGERYFVSPYGASNMEQFREWIINPDSFQRWNEKMMYDAYLDKANFTEFPDDDTKKSSNTPAALEAVKHKLINLYREKNGDTYSDKQSKPKPENESHVRVVSFNDKHENEKQPEQQQQKHTEPDTASNDSSMPDTPIIRLAKRVRNYIDEQIAEQRFGNEVVKPFSNDDLRKWAEQEFGGTIGKLKYDQKQAYDAMEMGINMYISETKYSPADDKYSSYFLRNIFALRDILYVIPTQTNRTPEQVEAQQFSTPPTLAYFVNWLANIGKGNTVLEPSAGTGNLAVFAKNAGANLILNDYSESGLRADILDALGWGKVYREDAMQLGNILAGEVREGQRSENDMPDRVIMNPPFSSAWNLGGKNKNQNGFKHVMSALEALREGGRLVAILGAGRDGNASSVKTWLKHIGKVYNVRALITSGGKAYQKYGTTFSNAVVVIDKTGATPKGGTAEFAFSGDFSNNEEVRKLFDAMQAIRNDIQDGDNPQTSDDSIPPKPEPPNPAPAPKNDTPKAEAKTETTVPKQSDIPDTIKNNAALRAIHKYLKGNTDLTLKVDEAIRASMEMGFRGDEQKRRQIKRAVYNTLLDFGILKDYAINQTEEIFDIISREVGYDSKALEIAKGVNSAGIPNALNEAEKILSKLNDASYDELKDTAESLGVDVHSAVGTRDDSEGNRAKLRTAIKKALKADSEPTPQEKSEEDTNSTSQQAQNLPNSSSFHLKEADDILEKLDNASFEELKDIATDLAMNWSFAAGSKEDSQESRNNLREAIKRDINSHYVRTENDIAAIRNAKNKKEADRIIENAIPGFFATERLYAIADNIGIDEAAIVNAALGQKPDNNRDLADTIKYCLRKYFDNSGIIKPLPSKKDKTPQQEQKQPEFNTQPDKENDSAQTPEKVSIPRKSSKELEQERKALREQDKDSSIQSTYTPTIITQSAKHHPADLVESTVMSSVPLPNVKEKPNIPQFIIDEGRLSDAQMEAVTLAVNSFSHILPNKCRRGFFIGDGTGVGKGREISGIIMDTLSRGAGNGKAIWISDVHTLIRDAKRDWQGLDNNPNDIFPQKGIKAKETIKQTKGILFTAYSHMASKDRIKQLKDWLGENWDGIIVLDEAHNANNVLGTNSAIRALNTRDFIKAFPKARVLYVSATGDTKLENFAMLDRLGIWGYDDAPFESAKAFNDQLSKGGIAAMEVAARDFKAMGLFIARSLSMRAGPYGGKENVTFRTLEHKLDDDEIEIYDTLAEIWQMIEQEMPNIMVARGYDPKKGRDFAKWKSVFWGAHQRFFNQIITSFQTDETILDMQKQLDAGNSCLVQLTNTLEANLNRAIKKGKHINSGNDESVDDDFDLSPKDILIEMVNNLFDPRVVQYTVNDDGDEIVDEVKDSSGKPVLSDAVLRKKQQFIDLINSINRFPQSPIDKILSFFGHENVAEITGRSQRPRVFVDKKTGKKSNLESGRTDAVRNAEINDFNSGKRRILIFSEKGGTGASYHASNDFENKQKRIHYLLQAGWAADKALQGLGRSHRSNEAHKPEYRLVTTDIPGQKRFISTIARRLAQLGALTTGERRTATSGLFSEGDNLEASYVTTALGRFIGNLLAPLTSRENPYPELDPEEVITQLGYSEEKVKKIDVTDFLNRLLAMKVDMQKMAFARFQQEIDTVKEVYLANGTDIDAPAENVKAVSINIINEQNIHHSDLFGTDTNYLELEITRDMNPRTWQEIQYQMNIGVEYRFYALQSGKIVAAVRSGRTYDTETRQMIPTYRLVQPDRRKVEYGITDKTLSNSEPNQKRKFTPVDVNSAQAIWMTQTDELPDTFTATEHMITGAMLPVWNLIEDYPKVWRITTDDGREFLGRIIPNKQLQKVLQALHVKFEGKKYNADSIKKVLDKRGTIVTLLNKAKLKFSRVSGEKLLEIIPTDEWQGRALKRAGLISMIINSKERFFFPKGNDELLNTYLEKNPVAGEPVEIDDADEIIAEAVDTINSSIPDSGHLHIIHPSFWNFINDPDDNPLIHESNYPLDSEPREYRYQASKNADSSKSAWQHIKEFGAKIWKGRHDIPELADEKGRIDDSLIKAQEWLRGLKRERQANVHETEKQLRSILLGLTPDDFDLFQRAMELRDLYETQKSDPNASMPWGLNPNLSELLSNRDPVKENYENIMGHVRKNPRVQEAMKKSDILMEDIRKELVEAADRLGMFDVRDRLSRKYYFRHLVLEYYNMQRSGKPHPTFKNPTARGYMKHREGSDKDISSNWILAMGEVFTRMFDDIKILDTLFKLREEYDIIEDIRQQAINYNMEHALAKIMRGLQDIPEDLRKAAAEKKLGVALNTTQARAMTRLFNLAKKGDLPVGNKHEWEKLVSRMAEAGQLEKLSQDEQQTLARYIGWLSDMPASTPARKAAKTFLTGIKSRIRALKSIVGDDYLDWQDLIPEDYTIWSPSDSRLVFSASTLPEYMLKIATENIDALLGADASDIGKMIASGGDKQIWVIPTRLADALDNIGKSQPMGAFKRWVTVSPVNGRLFKYNWRNFFGDLEAVLQGNPGALYYFKQAAKELTDVMLRGGIATGTLEEFQKRGGGLTTEAMTELERPDRIKEFSHLFEQKKTSNPLKWGVKALREYLYIATTLTNFRESILRYAAFLSYIQLIKDNNGVPPFYGMSKPREVKAVGDDIYDIAFKLANENLGAYDQISSNLQWLRDNNFTSFMSWVEVNTKRAIQMYANIWQGNSYLEWWLKRKGQKFIDDLIGGGAGNGNGGNNEPPKGNNGGDFADDDGNNNFRKLFCRLSKKSAVGALRLAITLALAAPLWVMLSIWNMLNGENDENLPPDVRKKPHLTIGTNAFTGEVMYMGDVGSAFDALQMFGVGNIITGDLRDLLDGRTTFGEVAANIIDGPISKLVSNANPFAKAVVEGFFGKRTFPSALHPTPIRDKGRFVAQSFGLEWYYDFLTDKPHKPFYDFSSSVVNTSNQDSSAYFYMLSRRKQFEENVLGKSVDASTMTRRGEALRNAKRAADLGDRKSLRTYLREYFRAGGSEQGLKISARTMEPLYGLNDTDEMRFIRWLPKEERKILRRAMRYAERIKARLGVW